MAFYLNSCLLVLAFFGGADPEPKKVAPPKADIRGEVTKRTVLNARGYVGHILVEGKKEKDTQHDKASVRLTSKTKFYTWSAGKKKEASFKDITAGSVVQCAFVGPVAESYPVQATAAEVLILKAAKK